MQTKIHKKCNKNSFETFLNVASYFDVPQNRIKSCRKISTTHYDLKLIINFSSLQFDFMFELSF